MPPGADTPKLTFATYAEQWLAQRELKDRTRDHYRKLLDRHLLPAFGNQPLTEITADTVRTWHARFGVATPTQRAHCYGLLRTIMGTAVSDGHAPVNPCVLRGAGIAKRVHKIRPATLPELEVITNAMPGRYQAMVLLASWCAMRIGELTELRRKDIDLIDEVVRVRRAVVRVGGQFRVTTPKSQNSIRDISIPPHLLPAIEAHLDKYVSPDDDALLFPARHGGHLAPGTLYLSFYPARDKAGRPDLRWHDLRHSGAVMAALTGASLAELMGRLGHSTPEAALRYQHVAKGRDREIAAQLSKLAGQ